MKQKIYNFFFKDGWLTKNGSRFFFWMGWVFMLLPLWLATHRLMNFYFAFLLFCIGVVMGLVDGYEGKAKQFGYQAPFTNDPLGWRKAKQSYEEKDKAMEKEKQP